MGLALLLLLPLAGPAGALDRENAEARLEVYVADKEGKPVSGLGRDDFELYEGGEKVPITGFAVRLAAPEPGAATMATEGPPALALFATYDGELRLRHVSLTDRTELDAHLAELARESPRVAQRHGERINLFAPV